MSLECVAVCCSVLQCVAVCCSVLQCVAVRCVLHCCRVIHTWHDLFICDMTRFDAWRNQMFLVYIHDCNMTHLNGALQHTATRCNTLQHMLQHTASCTGGICFIHVSRVCCSVLQCVAVCCSALQCVLWIAVAVYISISNCPTKETYIKQKEPTKKTYINQKSRTKEPCKITKWMY